MHACCDHTWRSSCKQSKTSKKFYPSNYILCAIIISRVLHKINYLAYLITRIPINLIPSLIFANHFDSNQYIYIFILQILYQHHYFATIIIMSLIPSLHPDSNQPIITTPNLGWEVIAYTPPTTTLPTIDFYGPYSSSMHLDKISYKSTTMVDYIHTWPCWYI